MNCEREVQKTDQNLKPTSVDTKKGREALSSFPALIYFRGFCCSMVVLVHILCLTCFFGSPFTVYRLPFTFFGLCFFVSILTSNVLRLLPFPASSLQSPVSLFFHSSHVSRLTVSYKKRKVSGGVLLSHGLDRSTIGAGGLNCRVRHGTGCVPSAMATENFSLCSHIWFCDAFDPDLYRYDSPNLNQIPAGGQRARNVRLLADSASSRWSSE